VSPRRLLVAVAAVAGLLVVVAAGAVLWVEHQLGPAEPSAEAAEPVLFEVPSGAALGRVAAELEAADLVRDARAFTWLARLRGESARLHAGEYELSPADSSREILDTLVAGRVVTWEVVLPEGLRARQVATRLEEAGLADAEAFLELALDPETAADLGVAGPTLEGYLFPETYRLPRGLPPRAVAQALVGEFLAAWEEIAPRAAERGLGMRETVTLASIVEKETGAPDERPLIAGVFWNRLRRGMRLESDPTVIYGIPDFDGNLRRVHLEDPDNAYNTYRIPGLPPGPIANPGRASLRAVVDPADTDYLFFVSRNDGTHVFSRTYREHAGAVDRYQRRGRSR